MEIAPRSNGVSAVIPVFLAESHFAFLGYSQNIRQTPVRRQLDYLRVVGASKESAKELRPPYSNVVRFQAFHAPAGKGCDEDPSPRRYIIISSL